MAGGVHSYRRFRPGADDSCTADGLGIHLKESCGVRHASAISPGYGALLQ